jgi:hypothetical protein
MIKKETSNFNQLKKFLSVLKENGLREISWWGWEGTEQMLTTELGNEWGSRFKKLGAVYAIEGVDVGDKFQGEYTSACSFGVKFKNGGVEFISRDIAFDGNTEEIVMESINQFNSVPA